MVIVSQKSGCADSTAIRSTFRPPQAYKNNFLYPRYLFFTISWYLDGWWADDIEQYGCTADQMKQVLQHTLSIVFLPSVRYLDPSLTTDTHKDLVSMHIHSRVLHLIL